MRHTISIRNHTISCDKIACITYMDGFIIMDVSGYEPLEFKDDIGNECSRIMSEWREYLESKQANFMEAVQYGIVLASERGNL